MNPPDIYDAGGQLVPERRRTQGRRQADDEGVDPVVVAGWLTWVGQLIAARKRLVALVTTIAAAVSFLAGYATKARAIDTLEKRMGRNEVATDSLRDAVKGLARDAQFQNLVLCLSVPPSAPERARQLCAPTITRGFAP